MTKQTIEYVKRVIFTDEIDSSGPMAAALDYFARDGFWKDALQSAQLQTPVYAVSPYSREQALLVDTKIVKASFLLNMLVFKDLSNGAIFGVVQDCNFYKAMLLPDESKCITESHFVSSASQAAVVAFLEYLKSFHADGADGVIIDTLVTISHTRPYHQLYDQLPCALMVSKASPHLHLYWPRRKSFLDIKGILPKSSLTRKLTKHAVTLLAGRPNSSKDARKLAAKFFSVLRSRHELAQPDGVHIWLGMCAMKRSWSEFEVFVEKLVTKLDAKSIDAQFYFDGLTCPTGRSIEDFRASDCEGEMDAYQALIERLGIADRSHCLIGTLAEDKLKAAAVCNLFVANALTDSVWPAAIMQKPGVAHFAPSSSKVVKRLHLHPNSTFLDPGRISEQTSKNGRPHWSDYSIDPDYVLDAIWPLVEPE